MARINNAITFGAGFNIAAQGPIDSRMRVEYESDLINSSTWPSASAPLYNGLTVTVMETGDIWVLKDVSNYQDKTNGTGWIKVGGGNAIEDASVLPNAGENKSKLIRLESDDNVYVSELKSRTTITTNRLPDAQQIDKAYLYGEDGVMIFHYKGAWKILLTDGNEIDGYGWLSYTDDNTWYIHITNDNAENASLSTLTLFIGYEDAEGIDLVNHTVTYDDTITEYNWNTAVDVTNWDIVAVIPATYNAPEANQIGNAYVIDAGNVDTGIYNGTLVTFEDTQGSGEDVTGYKWTIEGSIESYIATSKPTSEIYFYYDEDNDVYYTDATVWGVHYDIDSQKWKSEITIIHSGTNSLYIPQLNAPDSEQVDNANFEVEYDGERNVTYVYKGMTIIHCIDGDYVTYMWLHGDMLSDLDMLRFTTYNANSIYDNSTFIATNASEYWGNITLDGNIWNSSLSLSEFTNIFTVNSYDIFGEAGVTSHNISTVKYQRTEVTEEWDWQPLTDNATNEDIDAMFGESPIVKRVLMKDSERYGYSINEGWINFNDETMSYDGGTYYKWLKYSESSGGEAVQDNNYYILTDTLNPTLPFDVNSNECVFDFEIESEGVTYRIENNETYSKIALIHEDGSITYEE